MHASFLSVGFSWERPLSGKLNFGFGINLGFSLDYVFGQAKDFKEDVKSGMLSVLELDVGFTYQLKRDIYLQYGAIYAPGVLYNVPTFDGGTGGNFKGLYINPWFGKNVQVGWRLSYGHVYIDGGSYPSINSFGAIVSLLKVRIILGKKRG